MSDAPMNHPATARPKNTLAVAALVVGIVAFLTGIVPWAGLLLGLTAFGLGIYALTRGQSKVMALVGGSLGSIAGVTGLISTSALMMWLLSGNA
ncbi:hypothetical protein [Microbacterium sp. 77mftsu3.1]|uniref:hypothetical protein n=1 Tax=Microbacterium sp. 77mftsu3.1 TaxID=1761802 RepID=UPI00088F3DA6|nr:hypothetical protein [Microbacterium sp. 77mftsu3.1]SDG31934.1 hypothetical protein SAMN04488590_0584 [Microbacterium sp. 77mftsu3.1]